MTREVTLEEVLAARDARVARRAALLQAHGVPVLQVTLVLPGPVKDFPEARRLMAEANRALAKGLHGRGWRILADDSQDLPTGPERLLAVEAPAMDLKAFAVSLEDGHPLGRLWDLDVVDPRVGSVGRSAFGLPPRTCLLCGENAKSCARSRRHAISDLMARLKELVQAHAA